MTELEGPYKLPEGWRWVKLGEVVQGSFSGGTPSTKVKEYWNGDIPWTTSAPIAEDDIFLTKYLRTITPEGLASSATRVAPKGSLVVATRVGVGKAVVAMFDVAISQDLTALLLEPSVEPVFLSWLFKSISFQRSLGARIRGTTIKGITRKALLAALIPLPPLSEQRRIVARVEELMERVREAKRLREEAKKDADRLMQAALAEAFPKPGEDLPPGWRWVRLGEVVEYERRSIDPRRFPDEIFLLYSIPSYDRGKAPEKVRGEQIGSSKLLINGGVCLFSKLNPRIPRAWTVPETASYRQLASTEFMPLRPVKDVLDLDYLAKILFSETFLQQVRRDVTGATGSRQRLKPDVVLTALIPLPPLSEQRRIVAYLDQIQAQVTELKKAQEATEAELHRLEQAILDKAFRGEL